MLDETTPYIVSEYKAKTVREFIEEVLKERPREWGYISVGKHYYQDYQDGSSEVCEYRYGKLVTEMPNNALDVEIKKIDACGGWSRMDYTINLVNHQPTTTDTDDIMPLLDFIGVREIARMQRLITKYENVITALCVLAKTGTETKLLKSEDSSLDGEINYLWRWIKGEQAMKGGEQ